MVMCARLFPETTREHAQNYGGGSPVALCVYIYAIHLKGAYGSPTCVICVKYSIRSYLNTNVVIFVLIFV